MPRPKRPTTIAPPAAASELVDFQPLTERILMLHFNDGHVQHHQRGEPRSAEKVFTDPLDVIAVGGFAMIASPASPSQTIYVAFAPAARARCTIPWARAAIESRDSGSATDAAASDGWRPETCTLTTSRRASI